MSLYLNGQEIENYEEDYGVGFDEDVAAYSIPDYILINKRGVEKVIMDLTEDDIEALRSVFRIDLDKLVNKKVRIFIEPMGPKDKGGGRT
jgi:hypothetical protein